MKNTAPSILTICRREYAGADRSFINLSENTGRTRHLRIKSFNAGTAEIRLIADVIRKWQPRAVLFGGWHEVYEGLIRRLKKHPVRFGVYLGSGPARLEMADELKWLFYLADHPGVDGTGTADALNGNLIP